MLRGLLIAVGWLAVVLGVIGIFLPVMPTTPFLLLASACFVRSSPRFHDWLINHRYFGAYLRYYMDGRGIPRKAKIGIITLLWITITPSAVLVSVWPWLTAAMLLTATMVSIYIARQPEPLILERGREQSLGDWALEQADAARSRRMGPGSAMDEPAQE